ncbi:MAG: hypothetical protein IH624_06695 [Phycisphaerae bacterium]|nr:hypothetical protein [Phycisphaerae bacterium]
MNPCRSASNRRGGVLVAVTVIGVILAIIQMGTLQLGFHSRTMAARSRQELSARCAADAALNEAVWKMRESLAAGAFVQPPNVADVAIEGMAATYDYTITNPDPEYPVSPPAFYTLPSLTFRIDATGYCAGAIRTVHAVVHVTSVLGEGVGVKESIDFKNSITVETWPVTGGYVTVRSNTTTSSNPIWVRSAVIFAGGGEVLVGPGGDPESIINVKNNVDPEPAVGTASEMIYFEPVAPPPIAARTQAELTVGSGTKHTLGPGSHRFGAISIDGNGVLEIDAGAGNEVILYVDGMHKPSQAAMTIGNTGELRVTSGAVKLFLGGDFSAANGSIISNYANDATKLRLYGLPQGITDSYGTAPGCQAINLNNSGTFYGSIYAPEASVNVNNSGDLYGAIVAEDCAFNNSSTFYLDTRLLQVTDINDPTARFSIVRWWED